MQDIKIDPLVDSIVMPENLRVGLMVAEYRRKCLKGGCSFDYAGFAFGQSPFHVPAPLMKALGDNADKGHYSSASGLFELRRAVSGFYSRYFDFDVDIEKIMVGAGSKDVIFTIFTMLDGDVIIPSPAWIGYYPILELLGKTYHTMRLKPEHDYRIHPDELEKFLHETRGSKNQRLLVINNPHNPTGAVYSRAELSAIADVCRRNNTLILSDEIYALSTFRIEDFTTMAHIYPEGAFVTNGLSKDRSSGGYRLGTCILPDHDSERLGLSFAKVVATIHTNVSTPIQHAAVAAYEPNSEIDEYFRITRAIHSIMCRHTSEEFNRIDGISATTPQGGFYFYADFNHLRDDLAHHGVTTSNEFGHSLLGHPHHVAAVTGDALMLEESDFGARIACVDYDGKYAFEEYKINTPETKAEEAEFVRKCAPKMIAGIEKMKAYIEMIKNRP